MSNKRSSWLSYDETLAKETNDTINLPIKIPNPAKYQQEHRPATEVQTCMCQTCQISATHMTFSLSNRAALPLSCDAWSNYHGMVYAYRIGSIDIILFRECACTYSGLHQAGISTIAFASFPHCLCSIRSMGMMLGRVKTSTLTMGQRPSRQQLQSKALARRLKRAISDLPPSQTLT